MDFLKGRRTRTLAAPCRGSPDEPTESTLKRSSILLASSLLTPFGLTGCADPCLDDGLLQSSQDGGCPAASSGDSSGSAEDPSTTGTPQPPTTNDSNNGSTGGDTIDPTDPSTSNATADDSSGVTTDDTSDESTGSPESTEYCEDLDGDGFGDARVCVDVPDGEDPPSGHVPNGDDCLDDNSDVYPGAASEEPELCGSDADGDGHADASPPDGADPGSDCVDSDSAIHPGAASEEPELCTSDADGDGFGPSTPDDGAEPGTDCVDSNENVFPGAASEEPELCTTDADGDGFGDDDATDQEPNAENGTDCIDSDANAFPGAAELDDENACMSDADDDGYGDSSPPAGATPGTDCDDAAADTPAIDLCLAWCIDSDNDGFGDPDMCIESAVPPLGYAGNALDCDDSNSDVYTGAAESEPELCTADIDDDGYGDSSITDTSPEAQNGTDCDDADVEVFAGAAENEPTLCTADADNDGYGDANATDEHPNAQNGSDCADDSVDTFPGAADQEPTLCTTDADGDGYGDANATDEYPNADNGSDCDDDSADTFPGVALQEPALCTTDADGDGYGDANASNGNPNVENGSDCADDSANIFPGAAEQEPTLCTVDADGDGYGDDSASDINANADNGTDCADDNASAFPGSAQIDSPSGCYIDEDGDGYGDADPPDGVTPGTDCDDSDPGVPFVLDGIPETCELADQLSSSLGCEFFGMALSNLNTATYSVLLANANPESDASVRIEQFVGGVWTTVAGPLTVPSGSQLTQALTDNSSTTTEIRTGGSYRITSDIPIGAYQSSVSGATSDASLLLPATSWGSDYAVVGFDGLFASAEEYVGIIAHEDGTEVTVTPSRATLAGTGIPAGTVDTPMTFTLNEGETALVMSAGEGQGIAEGLSGTLVSSSSPVGVFTGTECSNIPSGVFACDHIEDMLPPVSAATTSVVASRVPPRGVVPEAMIWEIYATEDTTVTFDAVEAVTGLPDGPVDIAAGESLELSVTGPTETPGDFVIDATSPIIVSGYITGAGGTGTLLPGSQSGDPAQVVLGGSSQMLQSYVVGTVEGNSIHHVTLTHQVGAAPIVMDGAEIEAETYTAINADWEVARIIVEEGSHALSSDAPFATMVTGYNPANSYAYLGGGQARVVVCE